MATVAQLRQIEDAVFASVRGQDIPATVSGKIGVLRRAHEQVHQAVAALVASYQELAKDELVHDLLELTDPATLPRALGLQELLHYIQSLAVVGAIVSGALAELGEKPRIDEEVEKLNGKAA